MFLQYTPSPVEYGHCHCGCGQKTKIAKRNDKAAGHIKGQPIRFVAGHRQRLQKFRATPEDFWKRVSMPHPDECWVWQGATSRFGYGILRFAGKAYKAHRLAWLLTSGEIPDDRWVLHRCDNPPCCNPQHLFLGTHLENMQDMARKGRGKKERGEDIGISKLKESDIPAIRELHAVHKMSQEEIGRLYNVSQVAISCVIRGKTWKHVK